MRFGRIILGIVFAIVGLVVLGILGLYASQPSSYRIARSRVIAVPPAEVSAHLTDVRALEAWDPWPALPGTHPTITYSPVSSGVGAWVDRRDTGGAGVRTTITEIQGDHVVMTNAISGPLPSAGSTQTFELVATPAGTEVTWALSAELHGLGRVLWPFVGLEARIAPDMEQALTRLDAACH